MLFQMLEIVAFIKRNSVQIRIYCNETATCLVVGKEVQFDKVK